MSVEAVAEMTWQQAALADRGFRHARGPAILDALRLGRDDNLLRAQRKLQQAFRSMDDAAQVKTCTRAAARFLEAVSAGARLYPQEPRIPLPPVRPKEEPQKVSALDHDPLVNKVDTDDPSGRELVNPKYWPRRWGKPPRRQS